MLYIETKSIDAAFHFSVEEYITRSLMPDEPVLMIWQAEKCVMLGNYQVAAAEINMNFVKQNNIQIVRRSSGGGAIFTDLGTLLYTVIMPYAQEECPQQIARKKVAGLIVDALNKMGIPAMQEGRNDILVDGKKISGLAQYIRGGHLCTHGSLLYSANLDMLAQVLHVDEDKIKSKAIRSVRSRVANISGYMSGNCQTQEFKERLKQNLFEGLNVEKYSLSDDDLVQIDKIYHEKYANPSWIFGSSPKFSLHNGKRFSAGKVEVYLDVVKGIVEHCRVHGDFLGTVPIRGLEECLEKKAFQYEVMHDVLDKIPLEAYLGEITRDEFLSCIFE